MACFGLNICISYKINRKSQIHSYDLLFLSLTLFFCFKATLKFSNIDMLSTFSVGKANFPTHILTVSVTSLHISGPLSTWCSMRTVGMGHQVRPLSFVYWGALKNFDKWLLMEAVSGRLYFPSAIWSSQESIALSELYIGACSLLSCKDWWLKVWIWTTQRGGRNNIKDQRIFILDF